jgi:hypothetical protein
MCREAGRKAGREKDRQAGREIRRPTERDAGSEIGSQRDGLAEGRLAQRYIEILNFQHVFMEETCAMGVLISYFSNINM